MRARGGEEHAGRLLPPIALPIGNLIIDTDADLRARNRVRPTHTAFDGSSAQVSPSWTGCGERPRAAGRESERRDHATPTSITYLTTSPSTIVYRSSSSSSFASVRSRVSKPSVNQA